MNELSKLFDNQNWQEFSILFLAIMGLSITLGAIAFYLMKREQKRIAILGRFCDNPACVFHGRAITKKGYLKIDGREIFTRVLQTQSGRFLRVCDRCKGAIEAWKST